MLILFLEYKCTFKMLDNNELMDLFNTARKKEMIILNL